jgi:hypothetical protein
MAGDSGNCCCTAGVVEAEEALECMVIHILVVELVRMALEHHRTYHLEVWPNIVVS